MYFKKALTTIFFLTIAIVVLGSVHVNAAVLKVVSGSFTSSNGDAAHNFKTLEDKLVPILPQLYRQGHNPKITNITASIKKQGVGFLTSYTATIEDSADGKAWMGFTARGSFGNTASSNCPVDPLRQNYQIRADGQISGCENADGRSLEDKLKSSLSAGEVETIFMYDDPSVPVREYFIQFTKPATYPPIVVKQAPGTQNSSNQLPVANAGFDAVVVLPQNETVLEGSGTDSDGTIKSYTWTKDSGSGTIYAPTSAKTTITGLTAGTSIFTLTVTDDKGGTSIDKVTITTTTTAVPTGNNNSGHFYVALSTLTSTGASFSVKYSGPTSLTAETLLSGATYSKTQEHAVSSGVSFTDTFSDLEPGSTYAFIIGPKDLSLDADYYNKVTFTTFIKDDPNKINTDDTKKGATGGECTDLVDNQLGDGKDYGLGKNMGDGKADFTGVDTDGDGTLDLEPDPSCFSSTSTIESPDDLSYNADGTLASIIPCTDKCTFGDVFKLLNNIFVFFFTKLLIPLFVLMIMYAGFSYFKAQFNGGKKVEFKSLFGHMIGGILLILCAWLIVHTILVVLGYEEGLVFFQQ